MWGQRGRGVAAAICLKRHQGSPYLFVILRRLRRPMHPHGWSGACWWQRWPMAEAAGIEEWPLRRRDSTKVDIVTNWEAVPRTAVAERPGQGCCGQRKSLSLLTRRKNFVGKGLEIAADGRGHPLLLSCMASRICSEPQLKKGSSSIYLIILFSFSSACQQ